MPTVLYLLPWTACLLLIAAGPRRGAPLARVFVDKAGAVQLVDNSGHETAGPKVKDQVSAADARLAPDHQTAGWLVEYENCCTSYPVPLTLVIFRKGRIRHEIRPGLMIYAWDFTDGGRRAALCQGTVHGKAEPDCLLFDSGSGKLLETWRGKGPAPEWAAPLERE